MQKDSLLRFDKLYTCRLSWSQLQLREKNKLNQNILLMVFLMLYDFGILAKQ